MTQPTVHYVPVPVLPDAAPAAAPAGGAPDAGRRQFLKAAPLGALAIAAGGARAAEAAPAAAAPAPAEPSGYHETEHIRRYYATAAYW